MSVEIIPFAPEHLEDAARLLAARHRVDRSRRPELPAQFEEPSHCLPLVEAEWSMDGAFGAAALRDGRLAGYLIGRPWLGRPVLRAGSGWVDYAGHAVETEDAADLYRVLYSAVAPRWLERGCFAHYVTLPATDEAALAAWFSLGFGRWHTAAVRDVTPLEQVPHTADVEIHEAGEEDLDVVFGLRRGLGLYHTVTPMFEPYLDDQTKLRAETLERLRDPRHRVLLAVRGGEPLGMLALSAPDPPRMMATPGGIHIDEAFVDVAARGRRCWRPLSARRVRMATAGAASVGGRRTFPARASGWATASARCSCASCATLMRVSPGRGRRDDACVVRGGRGR